MRSMVATDVPPNFITRRAMGQSHLSPIGAAAGSGKGRAVLMTGAHGSPARPGARYMTGDDRVSNQARRFAGLHESRADGIDFRNDRFARGRKIRAARRGVVESARRNGPAAQ